jgi:hypothetical protein
MSTLNRAIIHHTAGVGDYNVSTLSQSQSKVRGVQNVHMDINGWSDVGYHFLFDKLGNAFEGRRDSMNKSVQRRGAHDGVNTNSFGFSNLGYYHPPYNHTLTTAQKDMMYDVIAWRMPNGWSPYGQGSYGGKTVGYLDGHRDAKATACPGDVIYNGIIGTNHFTGEARDEIWARIQGTGGGGTTPDTIIDNSDSGFSASSNWFTSTYVSGFYGSNYHARTTQSTSDAATWSANLSSAGDYEVFARWTAGTTRASSAPYIVYHTGGSTTVNVDQTANNGTWVSLGTFNLASGTSTRVALSCWTSSGSYVIADAVGFTNIPTEIIVDNTDSGFSASSSWITSTSQSGYLGSNYSYRLTQSVSDAATWSATVPTTGSYEVFARWTTGSNRATSAPFIVYHSGGSTTVNKNQQNNNGQWVSLGTFTMNAGTATRVALSCWTGSGTVVIADGIKLVSQ